MSTPPRPWLPLLGFAAIIACLSLFPSQPTRANATSIALKWRPNRDRSVSSVSANWRDGRVARFNFGADA